MERSVIRDRLTPDYAEFIIGPAHRVRPLAGPMAGSGRTRWLHPGYDSSAFSFTLNDIPPAAQQGHAIATRMLCLCSSSMSARSNIC